LPGQTINPIGLSAVNQATNDASRVSTISQSDFWNDLVVTLKALVGTAPDGSHRQSQAGIVIVRRCPGNTRRREVSQAMRLSVERQVMIEAKVVEVTLNRDYQAGVNWAAFSGRGLSVGQVSRGTLLQQSLPAGGRAPSQPARARSRAARARTRLRAPRWGLSRERSDQLHQPRRPCSGLPSDPELRVIDHLSRDAGRGAGSVEPAGGGAQQPESGPQGRNDQFFVTSITGTPIASIAGGPINAVQMTPTFNSFFSGVSLDITPQIDEDGNILLHIHPLVSDVQNSPVAFNFGLGGSQDIPLPRARSTRPTPWCARRTGTSSPLGGLMQVQVTNQNSGVPGLQDIPV